MALVVVLEVVADHEGLAAAALLALVRPLVGVRPHVLLQVGPGREGLAAAALGNVAVERVACTNGNGMTGYVNARTAGREITQPIRYLADR